MLRTISACLLLLLTPCAFAQKIEGAPHAPHSKEHVAFQAEGIAIAANHPAVLPLTFVVDPGFHINSHTPREANLIATRLVVQDDESANVKGVDFPKGTDYSFAASPNDKLDVYTGRFTLTMHLTAKPGPHTLHALLRYQACDTASCYPPRMLAIEIPFTAK